MNHIFITLSPGQVLDEASAMRSNRPKKWLMTLFLFSCGISVEVAVAVLQNTKASRSILLAIHLAIPLQVTWSEIIRYYID